MGFMFYLITFASIAVAKVLQYWWSNRRFYKLFNKLPLVDGHLPLVGVGHKFLQIDGHKLYTEMKKFSNPGPSPRRIFAGPMCFVIVDDPDQVQKVFTSKNCMGKIFFYKKFMFEKGLIVSSGALWKAHRKLIEPTFNSNALKSFLSIFNQKSKILVEIMEKRANGQAFNIFESWSALALDNILTTSTGVATNVQYEGNNKYLTDCLVALKVFAAKMLTFGYQLDPIFRMSKLYALEQKHIKNGLMKLADDVILEKEKNFAENPDDELSSTGKPQLFVDQLFKMRDSFSIEEIRDEINTVILAGFETVSSTLSLMTLLVALHSDVQDKIVEELENVFENADEEVTDEKMKQLTYLEYAIKETMRYWPPVPFVARCTSGEMELGGFTIPVGCNICIPGVQIHRDKRHWGEDADEFKPERFSPENIKKVHSYAYMPFSRGSRNCIGYNYAMNSLKVVLAHFFRNYQVSTQLKLNEIEFEFVIVTKVVNGFMVEVQKRNFKSKPSESHPALANST